MNGTGMPQEQHEGEVDGQSITDDQDGRLTPRIREFDDRNSRNSCNEINPEEPQRRSKALLHKTLDPSMGADECKADRIVENAQTKSVEEAEEHVHSDVCVGKTDNRETKMREHAEENHPSKEDASHLSHAGCDDTDNHFLQSKPRIREKPSLNKHSSDSQNCPEGDCVKEPTVDKNRTNPLESIPGSPELDESLVDILDFQSEGYNLKRPINFDLDQYPSEMKKRKALLSPPDPRPFFGCTWCGPCVKPDKRYLIQIKGDVCPACKYFLDKGWERIYLESSSKITFKGPGEQRMGSVRDFLKKSTQILSQKLGEGLSTFHSDHANITGTEKRVQTTTDHDLRVVHKKSAQGAKKSPRKKLAPDRLTVIEKKRPAKETVRQKKQDSEKLLADEIPIPVWANSSMKKRKMWVCAADPRPIFGCEWCGPSMQRDYPSIEGNICDTCQIFAAGMTRYYSKSARKCYFYDKNGKIRYESTLQYLKGTTNFLSDQPKDGPETNDEGLREEQIVIPDWAMKCIEARKKYVSAPDRRPTFGCTWCGPRMKEEYIAPTLMGSNVCPTCKLCQGLGWKLKSYDTSKHFMNKKGEQLSGVKLYLIATTPIVCKKMKGMSKSDLRALIPKYSPPSTSVARQTSKRIISSVAIEDSRLPVKRGNDAIEPSQSPPKVACIELPTVVQLLQEEKGLMGVLQSDVFRVFNIHFGSNQSIAAKIMLCLGKGQIPSCVLSETPFTQDSSTPETKSTQFIGVVRVGNATNAETKYGVAMPQFHVDCKELQESSITYKNKDYIIPRETKVNGQILLVRDDIEDEKIAGQFFAFMYRILYGSSMACSVVADCNMQKPDEAQFSEPTTTIQPRARRSAIDS
eukprot:CCRYP_007412-RA/>CCRYP_007412-RA protein AED:0.18 eAED:0.18 QI:155/1/1/1/0.6/0.66/6/1480/859